MAAYLKSYPHTDGTDLLLPLCHIYRKDLALRPELFLILQGAGLSYDDLITLDDLPKSVLDTGNINWFLVDHNAPVGVVKSTGGSIVGIIDHRQDEKIVRPDPKIKPHLLRQCGSCASLVTEYFKDTWQQLASKSAGEQICAQLAHLVLGSILIDTTNLQSAPKTTETDVWAVQFAEGFILSSQVEAASPMYDRAVFFEKIAELKEDCSNMTFRDILRKDYKAWQEEDMILGISTSPQPFSYLLAKKRTGGEGELVLELDKWADEQNLDILALMTTGSPKGVFQRELMLWARNRKGVKAMDKFLSDNTDILKLEPYTEGKLDTQKLDNWRKFMSQGEVKESRKQVAPRLRNALRSTGKL